MEQVHKWRLSEKKKSKQMSEGSFHKRLETLQNKTYQKPTSSSVKITGAIQKNNYTRCHPRVMWTLKY